MDDNAIIELYNRRSERALTESNAKYGSYCRTVAMNILDNTEDSEECVNDTWLRAWNSIPPKCPRILRMFFAKITRNLALDRLKFMRRDKRCPAEAALILDELSECIPAGSGVETELDSKELGAAINIFLMQLSQRDRNFMLRRYFFAETISSIAKRYSVSENVVSVSLSRSRKKLEAFLLKEGWEI